MPSSTIEILERVPSTMDAARERIQKGTVSTADILPTPFTGLVALEQTAGRGQWGRVWNSRPGASLCATFYFHHGLDLPRDLGAVSLLAGVAVATTLIQWADTTSATVDIGLKWPNDVLVEGKKLGGILIETTRPPEGKAVALIGVGINLSTGAFPPELAATAMSLEGAGISVPDPTTLAEHIAEALREQAALFRQEGLTALVARWRGLDRTAGRRFQTECAGISLIGRAEGIDPQGQLLLRLPDETLLSVGSASTLLEASA